MKLSKQSSIHIYSRRANIFNRCEMQQQLQIILNNDRMENKTICALQQNIVNFSFSQENFALSLSSLCDKSLKMRACISQ